MQALRIGVVALLLGAVVACAADAPAKKSATEVLNRGQQISTAVAAVTSTAISPLLGVCLLGMYDYARTSPEVRANLPFYSKPHFWIPVAILLLLLFFKDTIGGAIPLLKKPLDAVEILVINKAALVLLAFPMMYHQVSQLTGIHDISSAFFPTVYASSGAMETAGQWGSAAMMLIAGTIITLVVWVVGHAADVLALLSPIPYLDLVVKLCRAAILLAIAGCAFLNPTLGLVASCVVIAICAMLFWLAVRVLILGWVFAWDVLGVLLFSDTHTPKAGEAVSVFTLGKVNGVPRQTVGSLTRDANGILEFRYRRMALGPLRRIRLEDASAYEIGRGLLYSTVLLPQGEKPKVQFRLLPRYRGSEEAVRLALGFASVRDTGFGKLVSRQTA